MGVTELRANKTGYRKEGIDSKIPSLGEQRKKQLKKKNKNKLYEHSSVFVLSLGKELQHLVVL